MAARRRDCELVVLDRLDDVADVLAAVHGPVRARFGPHRGGRAA
jgi:hypothetical protein